ncbi:Putative aspartate aminotransferase [Candidatus Fokinia cryptica]|uniref:aspartate transaminase n=2 Tax=Candidatus Fokinia crypta TaxID=1920990 RepID=A0ABZ0URF5_9RICK|nr:Putative aspartate aminotransferase [Candidatus Fokinia cryptica]
MKNFSETGIISIMNQARKYGYYSGNILWANLGQGAPETEALSEVSRMTSLRNDDSTSEYAPVEGRSDTRDAIAGLYNSRYRDSVSRYSDDNILVTSGGRLAITKIVASLDSANIGYFVPDYTPYQNIIGLFKEHNAIPILLNKENGYSISIEKLRESVRLYKITAIIMSNPSNPIGRLTDEQQMIELIELAEAENFILIMDEVYSHYVYDRPEVNPPYTFSSAKYITAVDSSNVIIVDGLTKNWRYPGLRLAWIVASKKIIKTIADCGAFMDGGASNLVQKNILHLLNVNAAALEVKGIQSCFQAKRDYVVKKLLDIGIVIDLVPQGAFYVWADLSNLPLILQDGARFTEFCLQECVIVVPGICFDDQSDIVLADVRFRHYIRISFGPKLEIVKAGMERIEKIVRRYS